MIYDFTCSHCDHVFDVNLGISNRDRPLEEPCPNCQKIGGVRRCVTFPAISYQGKYSIAKRAGDGWNDVLKKVKKGSGRDNTIQTK